jgi:non-ribosomal peptide synthetase component F
MTRLPYQMELLDFSHASDPQMTLERWFSKRCVMPFELEKRAFDSVLIKIADEQFIWYLNQHHIMVDAFSTSLLYRRMMGYYNALLEGELSPEAPLHSFQEYIDYERLFSRSSLYQRGEAYWQEKLSNAIEPTRFYGQSLPKKGLRIRRLACPLGAEKSQAVREIAQAQDVRVLTQHLSLFNIFMTLMAAYTYRVSGNKRLAIGAPFHNRHSGQFAETIGLLMQICPLHIEIAEDDTFLSLLDKVKAETYSVMRHSQVGISNSVHQQAFDLMLNYHRVSFPDFCGYPTEPLWLHSGYGDGNDKLAIQVHDFKESGEFVLHFDFNRAIFDEPQSRRAIGHFLNLLEAFIEDRSQKIKHVNLLSPAERRELLVDFNQTATPYPTNQTVVGLFEAQVRRTPHQIAVSCRGESLTYQQLNRQANQLAHHLQSLGVGAEVLVAICMQRELLMLVGILGILKAGGAYLPLDPTYPQERLKFMLKDAGKPLLLSRQGLAEGLQEQAHLICLEREQPLIALQSRENPIQSATAENLAYIIYTSGSTGQPKGIMIPHRGLANYLTWAIEAYEVKDGNGAPVHSSISFDLTITSLFTPHQEGRKEAGDAQIKGD